MLSSRTCSIWRRYLSHVELPPATLTVSRVVVVDVVVVVATVVVVVVNGVSGQQHIGYDPPQYPSPPLACMPGRLVHTSNVLRHSPLAFCRFLHTLSQSTSGIVVVVVVGGSNVVVVVVVVPDNTNLLVSESFVPCESLT